MNTREQNLWKRILNGLPNNHAALQRIEDMTKSGVPDVYVISEGRSVWIELKAVAGYPAKPLTPVLGARGLSLEQRNWHLTHTNHGGIVCTLIGVGSREYFLVSGFDSDDVNRWSKRELERGSICFGRSPAFWVALVNFLYFGKK